jgi:hypothetical protein
MRLVGHVWRVAAGVWIVLRYGKLVGTLWLFGGCGCQDVALCKIHFRFQLLVQCATPLCNSLLEFTVAFILWESFGQEQQYAVSSFLIHCQVQLLDSWPGREQHHSQHYVWLWICFVSRTVLSFCSFLLYVVSLAFSFAWLDMLSFDNTSLIWLFAWRSPSYHRLDVNMLHCGRFTFALNFWCRARPQYAIRCWRPPMRSSCESPLNKNKHMLSHLFWSIVKCSYWILDLVRSSTTYSTIYDFEYMYIYTYIHIIYIRSYSKAGWGSPWSLEVRNFRPSVVY